MNREIKFRGLRTDGNGWAYGDLKRETDNRRGGCYHYIWVDSDDVEEEGKYIQVWPHSVGQFTGLKDKNGVEIYEGDFVLFYTHSGEKTEKVNWHESGMWLPFRDDNYIQDEQGDWIDHDKGFVLIGNIHQP